MAHFYSEDEYVRFNSAAKCAQVPHLLQAARHFEGLCNDKHVKHAAIGRFAVNIRGSTQPTTVVEVAVQTTMPYIKSIMSQDQRIAYPSSDGDGVFAVRIFIWTEAESSAPDLPNNLVELLIILSGNLGIPADLESSVEDIIPANPDYGTQPITMLQVYYQLQMKLLQALDDSHLEHFYDLTYLIFAYQTELQPHAYLLPYGPRKAYVDRYERQYPALPISAVKSILRIE